MYCIVTCGVRDYNQSRPNNGFLSRRSTCTQLLTTLNDWTISIDNHLKVDAVYIDFAKAFDKLLSAYLFFLHGLIYGNCQLHHRNVYPFHLEIRIFLLCNVQ